MENEDNRRNSQKELLQINSRNSKAPRRRSDTWIKYYHKEERELLFSDNIKSDHTYHYNGDKKHNVSNHLTASIKQHLRSYQSSRRTTLTQSFASTNMSSPALDNASNASSGHTQSFEHTGTRAKTFVSSVCRLYSGNQAFKFKIQKYYRFFLKKNNLYKTDITLFFKIS